MIQNINSLKVSYLGGTNHKSTTECWVPKVYQCTRASLSGSSQQKIYCSIRHIKFEWLSEECVTTHSASHSVAYEAHSGRPLIVLIMTPIHFQKHLNWAHKGWNWTMKWKKVDWSDEFVYLG